MAECRCCRMPVATGMLACKPHWYMLPQSLRNNIWRTYREGHTLEYAGYVRKADEVWKFKGAFVPAALKEEASMDPNDPD